MSASIVILTDLEGTAGISGKADSIGNRIDDPLAAGKFLTEEINACCEGLVGTGAEEIVVWDGHGESHSIQPGLLHPAAEPCNAALEKRDALQLRISTP